MFVFGCCSELSDLIEREKLHKKANVLKYSSRFDHALMLVVNVDSRQQWTNCGPLAACCQRGPYM